MSECGFSNPPHPANHAPDLRVGDSGAAVQARILFATLRSGERCRDLDMRNDQSGYLTAESKEGEGL